MTAVRRRGGQARGLPAWASGVALAAALTLLAACQTTPAPRAPGEAPREGRAPEVADPQRRAQVRMELATLYFGRGQHATALDEIRSALAARPDLPEAFALRALVHAAMGEAALAEADFQRTLQLLPADGGTMHNYGWFLCQQNRMAEAEQQFARAMAQPTYRDAPRTLLAQGVCLGRAGRWADAERALSRAYELDPGNPATAINLSEVLLRRGELERARFYIRRLNSVPQQVTSQSLWLAARIERRLGNLDGLQDIGRQLRDRFPQAAETLQFERGRFDD